jgi:hypothetical protein
MNVPFDAHAAEIDANRENRNRFKAYYERNKDRLREYNRQKYAAKKTELTKEEIESRRLRNRRSYYKKRDGTIQQQLESLRDNAREDRRVLIEELLADNQYAQWGTQTMKVVAFLVGKKETSESITDE